MTTRIIALGSLFATISLFGMGCLQEVDGNPSDPLSSNYVPSAPTNPYGYPATTSSLVVVWRDKSLGERGFQIERRDNQTGFVEVGRTPADEYYFYDDSPTLVRGTTYYYRVRSFSQSRYSAYSAEASIRLP